MSNVTFLEIPVGACTRDPERWTTTADEEAKAICRGCPGGGCAHATRWNYPAPRDCGPAS